LRADRKALTGKERVVTGKERVRRAIEFAGPDKVPHQKRDYWFLVHVPPQSWQPPDGSYPYLHPLILQSGVWKWEAREDLEWLDEEREAIDEFGTVWRVSGAAPLGIPQKGPLEDGWHLLDGYSLPDMKNRERFKLAEEWSRKLGGDRYRLGVDGNSIWESFHFLRGFENAMTDLALHPEEVNRLLGMLTDMTLDIVDNFEKVGCDGFMLVDDWGTQNQSFISPRHFEQFFFPCYKRIADRCHESGMHCGMHSCGDLKPLVPLMIETGLDFLQLDSPNMCGVDWLSENAAGRLCLWCSVDIQTVYPTNDPEKIERYVKDLILKLGDRDGGLVAWPYIEPAVIGVGEATVQLEMDLFERLGSYPIDRAALRS
jgi:hypothetical protein